MVKGVALVLVVALSGCFLSHHERTVSAAEACEMIGAHYDAIGCGAGTCDDIDPATRFWERDIVECLQLLDGRESCDDEGVAAVCGEITPAESEEWGSDA